MSSRCTLAINGTAVRAALGETLVDAGLGGRILVPHDCLSGQCETCRVRVVAGAVDDQGTAEADTVLACQATVAGDAAIEFDEVPPVVRRSGIVGEMRLMGPGLVEMVVALKSPLDHFAGQYVEVTFSGFPPRDLSPTVRLDARSRSDELVFHIRQYPGGVVSSELGRIIRPGHRVSVRGPFGQAFLREGRGPLVLIAGGTGFAPVWALAHRARLTQPGRDLFVIAGARDIRELYMGRALDWLVHDGAANVIATAEIGAAAPVRPGRPNFYLPSLGPDDTVYVAGPEGLVSAVRAKATAAGARCYSDPFLPSTRKGTLLGAARRMFAARRTSAGLGMETAAPAARRPAPAVTNAQPVRASAALRPPLRDAAPARETSTAQDTARPRAPGERPTPVREPTGAG